MDSTTPLGRFLRARRDRLRPADVGLPDHGDRRRVPGLRRDEVARLAGVGESYYTRLEQGVSRHASPQVLDAVATALLLDDTEREHLHRLAGTAPVPRPGTARRPPRERLTEATRQLIAAFGDTPVVLLDPYSDVLAWNRTGHAFFAGHLDPDSPAEPGTRPNTARLVFTDPHTRDLYGDDWPRKARDSVGRLRLAVGRHPDDPALAALIGELAMRSADFATLWPQHRVRAWDTALYRMHHPLIGAVEITQQAMPVPGSPRQRIVAVTAPADSSAHAALTLLAHLTTVGDAARSATDHHAGGSRPTRI